MNKLSLQIKLIGSYLCLALIIMAVGGTGWQATRNIGSSITKMGDEDFPKVYALDSLVTTLTVFQRIERSLLISEYFEDENERANQLSILAKSWKTADSSITDLESLPLTATQNSQWQETKKKWLTWKKTHEQTIKLITNVDLSDDEAIEDAREKALDYSDTEARAAVIQARKAIVALRDLVREESLQNKETSRKMAQKYNQISLVVSILGGIISITFGIFFSLYLARSIRKISQDLSHSAEEVTATSSHISSSSAQVAEGASSQAASLEETSASMEEMTAMTKQNAENAGQADILMKSTINVIETANTFMSEMNSSMEEISNASNETSKIIKTIDEIAFQTNLLALNAAVEAARAGEAGSGFAVVADEVRNLAMRSAEAAKNTSDLIEGTVQKVNNGKNIVNQTDNAFQEVAESSAKAASLVGEISTASTEQAQGLEQIRKAIAEMDTVTQQNSATSEESAAAAQELQNQAQIMMGMANALGIIVNGQGTSVAPTRPKPKSSQAPKRTTQGRPQATPIKKQLSAPPAPKKVAPKESPEDIFPMDDDDDFEDF